MNHKLLSNLPITELNEETDFLGVLSKAELIKTFLIGSQKNINDFKMYSLYGSWGSGKSSLMNYLVSKLSEDFNTFFFEAWEYEKDENLPMSLLEFMRFETTSVSDEFFDDIVKYGGRLLRGLGKSIKLNIPLYPNGPGLELEPGAFIEEFSKNEEITFYEALKNFKTKFIALEDLMTTGDKPKFNIVFIDDLDRCEPQQVLNLISAIKLFFTYGEKTIFFCGIDKSAIAAAVKTKYGNNVKANEFLEKVFDISFSMPEHFDLQKLINHYFDEQPYVLNGETIAINERINNFFNSLVFTNPRRLKKVLNKYQILRDFIQMDLNGNRNLPEIDLKSNTEKSFFETILILYLIILHEFYYEDFVDFLNFEKKKDVYFKVNIEDKNMASNFRKIIQSNMSNMPFKYILGQYNSHPNKGYIESCLFVCLAPLNVEMITTYALQMGQSNSITVNEKYIDFLFYQYISSFDVKTLLEKSNNMTIQSMKNLINDYL